MMRKTPSYDDKFAKGSAAASASSKQVAALQTSSAVAAGVQAQKFTTGASPSGGNSHHKTMHHS